MDQSNIPFPPSGMVTGISLEKRKYRSNIPDLVALHHSYEMTSRKQEDL